MAGTPGGSGGNDNPSESLFEFGGDNSENSDILDHYSLGGELQSIVMCWASVSIVTRPVHARSVSTKTEIIQRKSRKKQGN